MVLLPPCEIFHIYLQPLFSQLSGFIYFVIVQLCLFFCHIFCTPESRKATLNLCAVNSVCANVYKFWQREDYEDSWTSLSQPSVVQTESQTDLQKSEGFIFTVVTLTEKKPKSFTLCSCFFLHPLPDLPKAAVRILSNVTFLFVSLSYTAESAIVTAFITFIPKFIESQFGIPASNASIYTGELNVHILKSISPHHPTSEILQRLKTGLNKSVF